MPSAGHILQLNDVIYPDQLRTSIANQFQTWSSFLNEKKVDWKELYSYIYATDTTTTSNASNPWMNTTTTPKLTQIRDNLYANYMASMFPKRKSIIWEGASQEDSVKEKADAIQAYASYMVEYQGFKDTISRLVLDYIDYGNVFATVDWLDERVETDTQVK